MCYNALYVLHGGIMCEIFTGTFPLRFAVSLAALIVIEVNVLPCRISEHMNQ